MNEVAVLILAAGMSRRLGRAKQTLPLAGQPIVSYVARSARKSNADRVIGVVGGARHGTVTALDGLVDDVVINENFAEGQGTSIAAGVRYLQELGKFGAVVMLLADQPGVAAHHIDDVISSWKIGAGIAMIRYTDRAGHPVLFDKRYFDELAALTGEEGGKRIIGAHLRDVVYVPADEPSPQDVDTEADWRRLQEHWPH